MEKRIQCTARKGLVIEHLAPGSPISTMVRSMSRSGHQLDRPLTKATSVPLLKVLIPCRHNRGITAASAGPIAIAPVTSSSGQHHKSASRDEARGASSLGTLSGATVHAAIQTRQLLLE